LQSAIFVIDSRGEIYGVFCSHAAWTETGIRRSSTRCFKTWAAKTSTKKMHYVINDGRNWRKS